MILEKAFLEMIFGSVDVLPVYGFLKTYNMMVTNMKDYVKLDPDDEYADFRYNYRDTMTTQFKQDSQNKYFSRQDQGKGDQIETLQNRKKFWRKIIDDTGFQYLMIFLIMIIRTLHWIILFAVKRYFWRLDN